MIAHWSRIVRSFLPFSVICFLFICCVTVAAEPNDTASLQSNGVICSKDSFGSPDMDACRRWLARLPITDNYEFFNSAYPFSRFSGPMLNEPCTVEIGVMPGARNNITWNTITNIATTVTNTCNALPGAPGGWGIYGPMFPSFVVEKRA